MRPGALQAEELLVSGEGALEKTLMLGKIESRRRGEQQRTRWLDASPTQLT